MWIEGFLVTEVLVNLRPMNRLMTSCGPAGSHLDIEGVPDTSIGFSHRQLAGDRGSSGRTGLRLEVALETEHRVPGDEKLLVHGAVRIMAGGTAFPQRLMLKDKGAALECVALEADLVLPHEVGGASPFGDGTFVGVVAVGAAHTPLHHRVAIGEFELGSDIEMALEAGFGILAGVDNELGAAAGVDMQTSGSVTPFTTGVRRILSVGHETGVVGRFHEVTGDLSVASGTGVSANECSARNVGRSHDRMLEAAAGNDSCGEEANGPYSQNLGVAGGECPTDSLAQSGDDSVLHEGLAIRFFG